MNFLLLLEYDGTNFCGSQFQPSIRTVQGELEDSVLKIAHLNKRAMFASRTDSGVHALGQIAKISIDKSISSNELQSALNFYFSKDLSVKSVLKIDDDFNPRTSAISRLYEYTISYGKARSPQNFRYSWEVKDLLDIDLMKIAASTLPKEPVDWSPFAAKLPENYPSIRELKEFSIISKESVIKIRVRASGFLHHQVRRMVGALQKVGTKKMSVEKFGDLINGPSNSVQFSAPAKGLNLIEVEYPVPIFQ
ncbi:MAG: tRNA pseudouridine(38-40) synthase TruA [Chloroflexi bacterium]|nr:tRNA pseudouridine(38-40) synthase TruA [Chloroflexota bacterium]|tara:strand:- start:1171 stop:1920 length:750 start_codon:yes stop_codon:yes gene_type:complete